MYRQPLVRAKSGIRLSPPRARSLPTVGKVTNAEVARFRQRCLLEIRRQIGPLQHFWMDTEVDGNVLKSFAPELLSNYPMVAINDVQELALDVIRHDNRLAAWR